MIRVIEQAAVDGILARLAERRSIPTNVDPAKRERAVREVAERFPAVSAALLVRAVDVAFAASTKMDEGRASNFSLSLVPRGVIGHRRPSTQILRDPIPLDPELLRKFAPAADVWSTCLLVDEGTAGQPEVWGVWAIPAEVDPNDWVVPTELVVRATAPASIHVALWGERIWSLERGEPIEATTADRSIDALFRALGAEAGDARVPALWAIVREIERRGHGGILALCAADDVGDWVGGHRVSTAGPAIEQIAQVARRRTSFEGIQKTHQCPLVPFAPGCPNIDALVEHGRFRSMARAIAGLANVDGAVILDREDLRVEAFAARLSAKAACKEVFVGGSSGERPERVPVTRLGGMRHRSAAHWVAGHPPTRIAIVVSADGVVSLFSGRRDGGVAAFRPLTQGIDRDLA